MAQVTKFRCDFCNKEVEDPYLEEGWIKISGHITRSWGVRKHGNQGDAQNDFLEKVEFCNVECLVAALNRDRARKRGPTPTAFAPLVAADPFKDPPKTPFEDLLDDPEEGKG